MVGIYNTKGSSPRRHDWIIQFVSTTGPSSQHCIPGFSWTPPRYATFPTLNKNTSKRKTYFSALRFSSLLFSCLPLSSLLFCSLLLSSLSSVSSLPCVLCHFRRLGFGRTLSAALRCRQSYFRNDTAQSFPRTRGWVRGMPSDRYGWAGRFATHLSRGVKCHLGSRGNIHIS